MGGSTARGFAGAALTLWALSASVATARPPSAPRGPRPDGASPSQARRAASFAWSRAEAAGGERMVHAQLASRIPGLSERSRGRLAAAILEEAALAGLDPLFVLAIIEVESGYDPRALSRRGARGLMQLRPATLRREVARSHLDDDESSEIVLNVKAGVRYYERLLRIFKKQDLALMAYNAGPNRISGYLKSGKVPERFRSYPRRVRARLERLRSRLAAEQRIAVAAADRPIVAVE